MMAGAEDSDTVEFLGAHSPFQELADDELARIAAGASVRRFRAGEVIAEYGHGSADAVFMVCAGRVELTAPGAELDRPEVFETLGPGALFGYIPLIIGGEARFVARAAEPASAIALPADEVRAVLGRRSGLTFLAESAWQSISARPAPTAGWSSTTRVSSLIRDAPVFVAPHTPVVEAVRAMGAAGQSCALIELPDGTLGIVTESDVTHRVVGAGRSPDVPVAEVMTAPARSVDAGRYAITTWLEMLEAGVRHMPVCSPRGRAIGVLEETDLLVAASRGGSLQRRIAHATDVAALASATQAMPRLADDLVSAGLDAESTCGVLSLIIDTTARRAVELALEDHPDLSGFAWITLGSVARREAMPSSDVDSALSWIDDGDRSADEFRALARRTHTILDDCGLPADTNGAVAFSPSFSRSCDDWLLAARRWLTAPLADHGLIMSSLLIDGRVILGPESLHTAPSAFSSMPADHPEALRLQLLNALSLRPRVRSLRDVLSRRGGTVDLKAHVIAPIVNLARWAGLTAGITSAPTPARLHSAVDVGTLTSAEASLLHEVFAMTQRLRLRHQITQLRAGHTPGDVIVLSDLSPLERSMLSEGVREISDIQRRVRTRITVPLN
ncbi:CBS domain-containing protein [Gordonia polyisoprenivorans]|uniref:CBS domain-containing protein n=2 Tax=Gordonia polyisoprenivorans TaxID=84595 RepID=A0A846WJ05_9ACTN|nr:putative nucleotidyltransferase substrate binding domain-containing protein [Gordonia polyisoprenivorans]NKY01017.1 CBS domain-containing protein [Gordonia polyisoprenivorans]WCB37768.1 DUF294 nucleotidyltransferase-like domain-containing protein [Gordonia polyisoprenivorans]